MVVDCVENRRKTAPGKELAVGILPGRIRDNF